MKKFSHLPQEVCTLQTTGKFFNIAVQFLQEKKSFQQDVDAYVTAIELSIRCGITQDSLTGHVAAFLKNIFVDCFAATKSKRSIYSFDEYCAALKGLVQVAEHFPSKASSIIEDVLDPILEKAQYSDEIPRYDSLLEEAVNSISSILKTQIDTKGNIGLVNSVFNAILFPKFYHGYSKYLKDIGFSSRVNPSGSIISGSGSLRESLKSSTHSASSSPKQQKDKSTENLLKSIVTIYGKITTNLNDPKVTQLILSQLTVKIHYPPSVVDMRIIEQLIEICYLGQEDAYNIIIIELVNMFKRSLKNREIEKTSVSNIITLPNAFLSLAYKVKNPNIRENLLVRIMKLFQGLGKEITSPGDRTLNSPLIHGMGYMLPIIAQLLSYRDKMSILDPDPESELSKLYRSVWFYCVLFRFVDRQHWRSDWSDSVRNISHKIPVLISKKLYYYQQLELELEAILQNGFSTDQDFGQHQRLLLDFLPSCKSNISSMNHQQIVYILSIYYLETFRASSGTFQPVFAYLEDPGITSNENLLECCKAIAEKVRPIFLEFLNNYPEHEKRESFLETETKALFVHYCSLSFHARQLADNTILSLAEEFPQILWNNQCVTTLLDLVDAIAKSINTPRAGFTKVRHLDFQLPLPDSGTERMNLLNDLVELATKYLKFGIAKAPKRTHTIVQEYISHFKSLPLQHSGVSLAIEICSLNINSLRKEISNEKVTPFGPTCLLSCASNFVSGIELKTHYFGHIKGMLHYIQSIEGRKITQKDIHKIAKTFSDHLKEFIQQANTDRDSVNMKDFTESLYRTVAFIILQQEIFHDLIHLACWTPVMIFNKQSLEVACNAWNWLLSAREDICTYVMTEIAGAWSWTVNQRIGLFSNAPREPSPLAITKLDRETEDERLRDVAPHHIWIHFLAERFVIIRNSSEKQLDIFCKIIQKALTAPFSVAPDSLCTRFYLLLVCLRLLHSNFIQDSETEVLFRERVYKTALTWFCYPPIWYNTIDKNHLEESVSILLDFCRQLSHEEVNEKKKEDLVDINDYFIEEDQQPQEIHLIRNLQRTRKLLLLLIGNEIDRIMWWNNPRGDPHILSESNPFSPNKVSNWKEYIKTAWAISPRICIHMAARFPSSKTLKRAISRKILNHPTAVLDIPEALPFLVTEANVKDNSPQLKHLLYWTNVTPPAALKLLGKNYNAHPLVTAYALRVLKSFSPETIIFYVSQLVQCLRYDKTGLVLDYLISAGISSELVAHQLIWNSLNYTEGEQRGDLADRCRVLQERIVEEMDVLTRENYEKEFTFIETVTKLSKTILIESPTKEARKPLLRSKVSEIKDQISAGPLYLPTNPDIKVHGVIPEACSALQSAAKAPILVFFECHSRDDERQIPLNEEYKAETHITTSYGKKKKKKSKYKLIPESVPTKIVWSENAMRGCIFKMGDDVRQDMLAVQLIDLFKRIFESAGLDLYLFPYKVIATKPECGLIELIPNAMSRNDLGKRFDGDLFQYFQKTYGPVNSEGFQRAQKNFIKSMAAYSIFTYILQVKDRHNGNILIDRDGHIVHIDFGFMFLSSPGGNIGFESDAFKLSDEMMEIMGGTSSAEPFKWFVEEAIKGYLSLRQYTDEIVTLVELLLETDLPCFRHNYEATIKTLKARLCAYKTEKSAIKQMEKTIQEAFSLSAKFRTKGYDLFQYLKEGIES